LLTARQMLSSEAVPVDASRTLDLLTPEEALTLFAVALGRGSPDALSPVEHAAAEQIVHELGQHTLAVKLTGAYAASARRDLGALAREVAQPADDLGLPGDDETLDVVRRSFTLSLIPLWPDARRLFAGLAAFATSEFGRQAALALGQALGQAHPARSVDLLLERALVDSAMNSALMQGSDRERLRLHPLMRAFATELFRRSPPAEQEAAYQAIAQHLAAYAEACQTDNAVLAADEGNLTGALEWAQDHGHAALVADLAHGLRLFWYARGRWRAGIRFLAWGVAAVEANMPVEAGGGRRRDAARGRRAL